MNFYEFFNFGKFVKIRDVFGEVTNSRSMDNANPSVAIDRINVVLTGGIFQCRHLRIAYTESTESTKDTQPEPVKQPLGLTLKIHLCRKQRHVEESQKRTCWLNENSVCLSTV